MSVDLEYEEINYTVASHYLIAIINDDWTGLDDLDVLRLTTFLDRNAPEGAYAWVVKAIDNEPDLEVCEVCNLMAECETLTLLSKAKPKPLLH